ncbi:MAG TPA: hypothetical protein DEP84_35225, partial [Chloroflexi bacterium]|nr:hypothetical protein [Chloroflexota bacterium]
ERDWLAWLAGQAGRGHAAGAPTFDEQWWQLQIRYFDVMREYQQHFDPFARTLPNSPADWDGLARSEYASDSANPTNLTLESELQAASEGLYCGDLAAARARLDEIQASAAARTVKGVEARERLAVAELLAAQDRALRRFDGWAYLQTAAPHVRERLSAALRDAPSPTGMHQELARLWLNSQGTTAVAWVSWLPIPGDRAGLPAVTRAYRLAFRRGADGRWLLTDFHPLIPSTLIPRNHRLCNPSFAVSS